MSVNIVQSSHPMRNVMLPPLKSWNSGLWPLWVFASSGRVLKSTLR